jgi:Na+/melibiose symporter-like transporter
MSERRLSIPAKLTFGLGELTLSTSLTALTMVYAYFLLQEAGLRPALAGLVPLIGRGVDAITDPLMGRLSDRIRWKAGRRRPFFLLGAIPYGLSFLALWWQPPFSGQAALFAYYATAYSVFTLTLTVLYVPYLALLPEMATGYDERTSLNTYRSAVGSLGMIAAISLRLVAEALGGDSPDFFAASAIYAVLMSLPWFAVYRMTFEPQHAPPQQPRSGGWR